MKQISKAASLVAVIVAAGCAPNHHITRAESMKVTVRGNGVMHYAEAIRDAVNARMYAPEQYAGKRCAVRMQLARDGSVLSARSEGGDAALCEAAIKAVQVATIPPAPSDEVYQLFKNAPLDFQY